MEILRNVDEIDFHVLMSGKMCVDEVSRCKRLSRTDCLRLPSFMRNEKGYKKQLRMIASLNGLNTLRPKIEPPIVYVQRLRRGRRIGPENGKKVRRVRRTKHKSKAAQSGSRSESFTSSESTESECEESITVTKPGQGKKKLLCEPFKAKFLFDSSGDNNILTELVSCCRDRSDSVDKQKEEMEKETEKTILASCINNNALNAIMNDLNLSREGTEAILEHRVHPSEAPWSLKLGLASQNNNVCTTIIHEENDAEMVTSSPEVNTHRSMASESRVSAISSSLTDIGAAPYHSKSANHRPVNPCRFSPEYCQLSKVTKTIFDSGREGFIYPDQSDLFENEVSYSPLTNRSISSSSSVPTEKLPALVQLPKLLDRRAKSAANCLRKPEVL